MRQTWYRLSVIALMLTAGVSVAVTQHTAPGLRELKEFNGWRVAGSTQETESRTVIFYKGTEIQIVRGADGFDNPKRISVPDGWSGIEELRRQGKRLLAVVRADSHYRLAWRSIEKTGQPWTVSPASPELKSRPFSPAVDPEGRMVAGSSKNGKEIFYQNEPGGAVKRFTLPLRGRGGVINRVRTIIGPDGIIWLFEDLIGGAINYKRLNGALRFKDGVITHHDLGLDAHVATAVPVTPDIIFVCSYAKPGVFMDSREGNVLEKGPFDPLAFGDHAVSRWSRAEDGTIWMVTFSLFESRQHKKERARNLYGQIWKWDGKELKLVTDGYDRCKAFNDDVSPVLGVSADRVLAGCARGGLFHVGKTRGGRINWQQNMRIDRVKHIHAGDAFTLISDHYRHFLVDSSDLSSLSTVINPVLECVRTVSDIEISCDGTAWAVVPGDTPQLAVWEQEKWRYVAPSPHTPNEIWGIAVDSENRPWVYGSSKTPGVWVLDGGKWTSYGSRSEAYLQELTKHDWQLEIGFMLNYLRSKPLVVKKGEIWHVCQWSKLSILRDGKWWKSSYKNCGNKGRWKGGPYIGRDGAGRIVQGDSVMAFADNDLKSLSESPPNQPDSASLIEECRGFPGMTGVHFMNAVRDNNGITWAATSDARLFGIKGSVVEEFSLAGSPAVSRHIGKMLVDKDGTIFMAIGGGYPTRDWIAFSPKIPRIEIAAEARGGTNEIEVSLSTPGVPSEMLRSRVRLDHGEWQEDLHLSSVREGDYILEIVCELKEGLSFCSPFRKRVTVTGDLDAMMGALVNRLGASGYRERREAMRKLIDAGEAARPYLEEAAGSSDPEKSINAKEVLAKLGACSTSK